MKLVAADLTVIVLKGVANENHGRGLRRKNTPCYRHIIRERYRWILNYT
jgi:hypothetical protein